MSTHRPPAVYMWDIEKKNSACRLHLPQSEFNSDLFSLPGTFEENMCTYLWILLCVWVCVVLNYILYSLLLFMFSLAPLEKNIESSSDAVTPCRLHWPSAHVTEQLEHTSNALIAAWCCGERASSLTSCIWQWYRCVALSPSSHITFTRA